MCTICTQLSLCVCGWGHVCGGCGWGHVCVCGHAHVSVHAYFQAQSYIRSLPNMPRKDFKKIFPTANPLGKWHFALLINLMGEALILICYLIWYVMKFS